MDSQKIDPIDIKILELLQRDGQTSYREIAKRTHRTHHTIAERIKRLKQSGILSGIFAVVDIFKLRKVFIACTLIQLKNHSEETFIAFQQHVRGFVQIVECHHVMGQYDFMLKIVMADLPSYNEFMHANISTLDYILRVESFPVLAEIKKSNTFPFQLTHDLH